MKFQSLINDLIVEISGEEAYTNFYSDMDEKVFKDIVLSDPQTIFNGSEITKIGHIRKI